MEFKDVCFEIENDPFYQKYFTQTAKVTMEESSTVTEQVAKLLNGIERLNAELERQVLLKHHDLLTQASHATNLENVVSSMQVHVHSLLTGAERLRSKVLLPYNSLESEIAVLENVQKTCHLLRNIAKIIQLYKKVRLEDDPSKQSVVLYELKDVLKSDNFENIDIIADDIVQIDKMWNNILDNATNDMHDGLTKDDKALLLKSFKIYQNAHCTKERIDGIVMQLLKELTVKIKNALNTANVSDSKKNADYVKTGPGKANVINTQTLRQQFWKNMENVFAKDFYVTSKKIILLQSVLDELHTVENFRYIAKAFWEKFSNTFSTELKNSSSVANQCVEIDFPKLLKCYNDLVSNLRYKDFAVKRDSLSHWENAFLSKSLSKLLDPVRTMWHMSQIPNAELVDNAVRVISSALSVSLGDKQLSIALASSVAKCIKQMSAEGEQRVVVTADIGQIIEAPSSSQQRNVDLCNVLYYFTTQVNRVLTNMSNVLPPESAQIVQDSLRTISSQPILDHFQASIISSIELILATIHNEVDLIKEDNSKNQPACSLYMKELQQFISRCKEIYLSMFHDMPAVIKCCENIATRCLQLFIVHLCTVRPLSQFGRMKLKIDCKQIEVALNPLISDLTVITSHYSQLRALHTLIGLNPEEILNSQLQGNVIPYSLVMLLVFSHAGPELVSPHVCAGWSIQRLVNWLDNHPHEKERILFITGALQRYQNHVRQNSIATYDSVHPILLRLLEDSKKNK